ncbi:unnamed protein product, partial [Amoebophrya sp. A25]
LVGPGCSHYWYNTVTRNSTPIGWPRQPADHVEHIEVPYVIVPIHQVEGYRNFPNDLRASPLALPTTLRTAGIEKADVSHLAGGWTLKDVLMVREGSASTGPQKWTNNSWDVVVTREGSFCISESRFSEPRAQDRMQFCLPNDVIPV